MPHPPNTNRQTTNHASTRWRRPFSARAQLLRARGAWEPRAQQSKIDRTNEVETGKRMKLRGHRLMGRGFPSIAGSTWP